VYVIAEIGINHGGKLELARELILGASEAGADAIKFQYRNLDRSYTKDANELGDDMLQSEIRKNYLTPYDIERLVEYGRTLDLEVGISFFTIDDISDFSNHDLFDFFKVPSVEFQNISLITKLLNLKKPVHASLGCQSESSIEKIMAHFELFENFHIMHCVSNYPVMAHNSNLGYMRYFKDKYHREIGYSSHEEDWRLVLAAVALGANTIERHISLGNRSGLDETSSTNIDDFSEMVRLVKLVESVKSGYAPRRLNQGELLNRQNLGRSYYSKRNFKEGEIIAKDDLEYLAPAKGLMVHEINQYISTPIIQNIPKGEVIRRSHFLTNDKCESKEREFCKSNKIALPVRLHDFEAIKKEFDIGNYEFHLSYKEVENGLEGVVPVSMGERYSIHLPDYISPLDLMDPFASDEIASKSKSILDKICDFATHIQNKTGIQCPVVGSFSVNNHQNKIEFYEDIASLWRMRWLYDDGEWYY
jgi:sialic acid synthase SpsE